MPGGSVTVALIVPLELATAVPSGTGVEKTVRTTVDPGANPLPVMVTVPPDVVVSLPAGTAVSGTSTGATGSPVGVTGFAPTPGTELPSAPTATTRSV